MRKPAFCICENKDADQLRGNCEADQRLCFRYKDSTIPLLHKSEISRLYPSSVTVLSETPKTGFLRTRLNYTMSYHGEMFELLIGKTDILRVQPKGDTRHYLTVSILK